MIRSHVLICGGTGCTSSGSRALADKLVEELKLKGLEEEVKLAFQNVTIEVEAHDESSEIEITFHF